MCIKCGKTYQTSGNTTNLSCHIKRIHPNLTVSDLPQRQQLSILSFIEKKYETSSNRKQTLDSALCSYITSDLRPFSVLENKGFRNFVSHLDPRYELPSRTTLRNVSMANAYAEKKAKLFELLKNVKHCAITSECWTSRANECHFVTADFELRNAVLVTEKLIDETTHSSENIANSIRAVLEEWSVLGKVTAMVTDNAKNMIKACEILQIRHVPCFAHSINLTVQDCLASENVKPILEKCKRIVAFFKSSTIAFAKFREAQDCERPYSLKQECPTRWNSAFYMVERILITKVAIASVLLNTSKGLLPITSDEISILEDLKALLSPFENATVHTSSSTSVTGSSVIPVACGILHNLSALKSKLQTKVVCDDLLQGVNKRLVPYESHTVTRMTTILDPRFKKEGFWNPFNSSQAVKSLEEELSHIYAQTKSSTSLNPPTPEPTAESNLLFSFLQAN
ncbi:E3 SUMO-protein ligase ZBED1-like [Drosophila yakuba]|uniref:E3 SUMO-protein ligase ZBED1-like n=1 Tax=Drosophila yakuba TaxID=7245 RepID=UPI0019308845|nr:E3 SUMO-protein ligase ZBED1-like [Drosophila yakuba]XP_039229250.1 E3 SUMO-protein ligase ZBED1-like [Drosophila yakuba]